MVGERISCGRGVLRRVGRRDCRVRRAGGQGVLLVTSCSVVAGARETARELTLS